MWKDKSSSRHISLPPECTSAQRVGLRWIFVTEQHPLVEVYGTNLTESALDDTWSVQSYH